MAKEASQCPICLRITPEGFGGTIHDPIPHTMQDQIDELKQRLSDVERALAVLIHAERNRNEIRPVMLPWWPAVVAGKPLRIIFRDSGELIIEERT